MSLDEFIKKRTGEGRRESEGSFSVDEVGALRKTLSSALPEPHFYLFQALQGLVKARAKDIKVAIGRRENSITYKDPERVLADMEELTRHFSQSLSVASNQCEDLIMSSLVTSLGSHVSSAEFHYGERQITLSQNGLSQTKVTRPPRTPLILYRRSLEKGLSYSWSRIWGARKEEFRVRKAFEYSPIPISIAGLPTSPRSGWRRNIEAEDHFALVEVAVVGEGPANHRSEDLGELTKLSDDLLYYHQELPDSEDGMGETAVSPNLLCVAVDQNGNPQAIDDEKNSWNYRQWTICFTNCPNEKAHILFVRNGHSTERVELNLGLPGLQVVAPGDDLDVDASGYQLVQNSKFTERVNEARQLVDNLRNKFTCSRVSQALTKLGKEPGSVLPYFAWLNDN